MFMESLYQVLGVKKADVGMLSLKGSTAGALAVGLSKKKMIRDMSMRYLMESFLPLLTILKASVNVLF